MKRNAVAALLAFVAFWPLAHRWAAARFGIDPWKLSGFAMYATPTLPVLVAVAVPAGGGTTMLDEASLPASVRADLDRFRIERVALGTLREPDDVAAAVLRARPDLQAVAVVVQHTTLDPQSARMVSSDQTYAYDRGLLGEPGRAAP